MYQFYVEFHESAWSTWIPSRFFRTEEGARCYACEEEHGEFAVIRRICQVTGEGIEVARVEF